MGEDDADDNEDDEDEEAAQEFSEFKKWLDESTPSSSDNKPSEALVEKNPCKTCGLVTCDWNLGCRAVQVWNFTVIGFATCFNRTFPSTFLI